MLTSRVFEAGRLLRGSSAASLQEFLRRQPGVDDAEANPVSQAVTVHYDESTLTPDDIRALFERFGCSCAGEVVPCRLCRDEQPAAMKQNLFWAVGYNTVAFPIAMGLFYPSFGLLPRPEIAALSMAGSSFLVAVNALLLKRTKLEGIRRYGAR